MTAAVTQHLKTKTNNNITTNNHLISTAQDQDAARYLTSNNRFNLNTETFVANTLKRPTGGQHIEETYVAPPVNTFITKQNAKAGSIGYEEDVAPSLKAGASGTNRAPTINIRTSHTAANGWGIREGETGTLESTGAGAGVRRLTPTECERLQNFPDGWTQLPEQIDGTANPKPDSHRYAQMGNAVTVSVARWIGERIMREVDGE